MKDQQGCQIWTLSSDRNEYERFAYQLGKAEGGLDAGQLNELMLSRSVSHLQGALSVVLVHDGCDLRKPHARQMEGLGKVRSLEGGLVNGYGSFNSVAIGQDRLHLLCCTPLSAQEPGGERKQAAFEQISRISRALREGNPDLVLTHLIDRAADDAEFFSQIEQLGDRYVIRAKANRNSGLQGWDPEKGRECPVKLIAQPLEHSFTRRYEKFMHRGRCHEQAQALVEYERVLVAGAWRHAVKVTMFARTGRRLFRQPMLLLTNIAVASEQMALHVFHLYLKRAKIEAVFKFLKDGLGWEQFQVRQLVAIKHIILLCFFIGSYFYEMEPELTRNQFMVTVCRLGGGKGKVTRHFFLKGLQTLAQVQMAQQFFEQNKIPQEQIQELFKLLK
ncbi:hypothetical protein BH24BAC1_BH24BAC1_35460 [soil metagenome]